MLSKWPGTTFPIHNSTVGTMDIRLTALERAFELAKCGSFSSPEEIRRQLKREGYSTGKIVGRSLSRQLYALIEKARPQPFEGRPPRGRRPKLA